jgi:chromosome segregation ATPase
MNLAGKILTFLIFLSSVIFMTMVLVVYATHTNWRDAVITTQDQATATKPLGLRYVLDEEKQRNQGLKDELDALSQQKNRELEAKVQALAKLENENALMKAQIKELQQSVAKYDDAEGDALVKVKATQEESTKFRQEVEGLRSEAEKALGLRDKYFKEVVSLTDEMNQMINDMNELKVRNTTLAADLDKAREVMRHFEGN